MYTGVLQYCWKTRKRHILNWVEKGMANSSVPAPSTLPKAPNSRSI